MFHFYHMCIDCNKAWFDKLWVSNCPRCGKLRWTLHRMIPPWIKR